jgi:hypothetical protein
MRIRSLVVLLAGVLSFTALASAQFETPVKVSVPFEFNVGAKAFAAGQYTAKQVGPNLLTLSDTRGRALMTLTTNSVQNVDRSSAPKLIFVRRDGRYFLSQVWWQQEQFGDQVSVPRSNTALAKQGVSSPAVASGGAR